MINLTGDLHCLLKGFCPYRSNHKLLKINSIIRMLSTI